MAVPVLHPLRLQVPPVVEVAAAFPPLPVVAAAAEVLRRRPGLAAAVVVRLQLQVLAVLVELRLARLPLPASRATCGHTWRTLRCDLWCPKLQL